MGKFEFNPEAVALKPLKKTLTMADRARIEAEVPKKMTRAEAKEKKELEEARKGPRGFDFFSKELTYFDLKSTILVSPFRFRSFFTVTVL